jgi:hypothetical protein
MNFSGMFETQIMLFLIMILGVILRKKEILPREAKGIITNLVIDVTLPASIIKSFQMEFDMEILKGCLAVVIVAVLIQFGTYILGMFLYPGFPDGRKKVLQYATICSNAGILGNPIAEGIFGTVGLLYASIYVIPQRIFMWSVGLTYFTKAPDKKTLAKKVATHPCILAVAIGLVIMIGQIELPAFLTLTIKNVAAGNTFLAMALIGLILSEVNVREMVDKETLYYSFVRLILIPLLVMIACRLAHLDSLVTGVCVVLSAMPAASVTAAMATKYEKDEIFATKCVVLSTILSMVTVPLWCMILG